MNKNTNIYFEVRIDNMSTRHGSLTEAKKELKWLKKGYPQSVGMSPDSHQYWKSVSKRAKIYQITETSKEIK